VRAQGDAQPRPQPLGEGVQRRGPRGRDGGEVGRGRVREVERHERAEREEAGPAGRAGGSAAPPLRGTGRRGGK
jgi:hypothetical protein